MKQLFTVFFSFLFAFIASAEQKPLTPIAEHHAHLMSAEASKMANVPPLPEIKVPEPFSDVLKQHEQGWNDKSKLASIFKEDIVMLNTSNTELPGWLQGRDKVAQVLSELFARPYHIMPVLYQMENNTGMIAGYLTRGEVKTIKYIGNIYLSLAKDNEGVWRIASEAPVFPGPTVSNAITADDLIKQLDDAGIQRAAVLSIAYWYGSPFMEKVENEYQHVKAENDWTINEVARYPERLVAFCGVNPLKDYALDEIDRCAQKQHVKGMKIHFGNSNVDLRDNAQAEKIRIFFQDANERKLAVVVHIWNGPEYEQNGKEYAEIFLNKILPAAPDIPIQIAHLAGGGRSTDSAIAVFADAISHNDPRTKNLYFDIATTVFGQSAEGLQQDAKRIRQIGLNRILYGTDMSPTQPPARESWGMYRALMPLTDDEFKTIAGNIAPYFTQK
jgi:predicted TIM-barrel fold metal-dependent hydrolase